MSECFLWIKCKLHGREKQPEAILNPTQQGDKVHPEGEWTAKEEGIKEPIKASMGKETSFNTGQSRHCENAILQ